MCQARRQGFVKGGSNARAERARKKTKNFIIHDVSMNMISGVVSGPYYHKRSKL